MKSIIKVFYCLLKKERKYYFFNYECKDRRKVYVDGIEDIINSDKFRKFIDMIKGV